ncbi:polysaccharide pyruvyl transferase family protein [Geobacillus stearothermophilus]|uniref:polysaccharide pyruvyl transferase family protein n=1 Tax=Geobacillus stearothermophilus TaxID=1422 RepID=UPI001F1A787E|nr:polysaccharide pyruvyl transferase family protein [Geobacillus stearothermophilus]MCK7607618.1 polysaccharide pyruvyl transferase family protein [Geobacillus stearothermophilus]
MKQKIKVLYRGAYNLYNFGDDLLFIANLHLLEKHYHKDDIDIYVVKNFDSLKRLQYQTRFHLYESYEIIDDLKKAGKGLKKIKVFKPVRYFLAILILIAIWINICIYRIIGKPYFYRNYINFMKELDMIHYIGGGYLAEKWITTLILEFITIYLARKINPKLVIIGTGLGIGPFRKRWHLKLLKIFLQQFDRIYVREDESLRLAEKLNLKVEVTRLGDDVILLYDFLKGKYVASSDRESKNVAMNLKDFPDHNYYYIKEELIRLLNDLRKNGYRIHFFSFGKFPGPDDNKIVRLLDKEIKKELQINNPYDQGLHAFLESMSNCLFGIGFAYHFNVICALLQVKTLALYAGDYYKQKIQGVMDYLYKETKVMSLEEFKSFPKEKLIPFIEKQYLDIANIELIYRKMELEYVKCYEQLLPGRVKQ